MSTIGPIPKGADNGRSCPVACKVAPYRPRAFGQDGCRILRRGAILAPGRRMVAGLLRIMGRAHERRFGNFHRVLDRAARSPHAGGRILLGQAITPFAPRGPKEAEPRRHDRAALGVPSRSNASTSDDGRPGMRPDTICSLTIDDDYRQRLHSVLGYVTPAQADRNAGLTPYSQKLMIIIRILRAIC